MPDCLRKCPNLEFSETFVLRQSCAFIFPSIYRVFIIVRKKTVYELHNLIIDTLYLVALDILL